MDVAKGSSSVSESAASRFFTAICFCTVVSWPLFMLHMGRYIPVIDNDEIFYIAQARTFSEHGFHGGLFSLGGGLPRLPTYFGPHGPAYPIALGTFGLMVGWHHWTPYAFNVVVMAGALACYFFWVRSNFVYMDSLALLLMGSYMWFLPSAMQEGLHASLAVLVAGILVKTSQTRSIKVLVLSVVTLATIAIFRYLWAIAIIYPVWRLILAGAASRAHEGWKLRIKYVSAAVLSIVLTSAAMVCVIKLLSQFTAYSLYQTMFVLDMDYVNRVLSQIATNVQSLFNVPVSIHGFARLSLALRIMYVATFVVALYFSAKISFGRFKGAYQWARVDELVFVSLYLLSASFLLLVAFYPVDGFRDYRVLSQMWLAGGLCLLSSQVVQTSWRKLARYKKAAIMAACIAAIFLNGCVGFVSLGDIYKLNVDPEKVREAKDKIDAFTSTASKDLMLVRDDTLCRTILITALHVTYEPSLSWWRGAPGLTFIDLDWAIEKKDYGIVLLAPSIEQFPENRIADYFRIPTDNSKLEVYANKNCYVSAS